MLIRLIFIYSRIISDARNYIMKQSHDRKKIPLFSSWTGWYILVLVVLAGLIAVFYWLTKKYS
ncbi:hypothetical protein A8C56_06790 [Niabella ginsenosidivorans]|uniref:Uncharacterized protein n=1 Tax=Niabella ginsenosidivorans TaxID=1176587 RepID=A0A1A9I1Y8_9BACT|nr:hypothetical protein A8C56_06790 [Niabella ginsenosidivorans]